MPGEDDRNKDYFGERPPPTIDPTKLTTEAVERAEKYLKELFDSKLFGMRELYNEKLGTLRTQILERDLIRDQAKIDANERIAAALQAQKEAVGKTETSFGDQMKSVANSLSTLGDGLRREISDLKDRINIGEGQKRGTSESAGTLFSVIAMIISVAAVIVSAFIHH
jgi:hypothetical protein